MNRIPNNTSESRSIKFEFILGLVFALIFFSLLRPEYATAANENKNTDSPNLIQCAWALTRVEGDASRAISQQAFLSAKRNMSQFGLIKLAQWTQAISDNKPVIYKREVGSYLSIVEAGKPLAVTWDGELTVKIERTINGKAEPISVRFADIRYIAPTDESLVNKLQRLPNAKLGDSDREQNLAAAFAASKDGKWIEFNFHRSSVLPEMRMVAKIAGYDVYGDGHFAVLLTDIGGVPGTFTIESWPYGVDDQPQILSRFPREQVDFQSFLPTGPYSIFGSRDGSWRVDNSWQTNSDFIERLELLDQQLRDKVLQVFEQQANVRYGVSSTEIYEYKVLSVNPVWSSTRGDALVELWSIDGRHKTYARASSLIEQIENNHHEVTGKGERRNFRPRDPMVAIRSLPNQVRLLAQAITDGGRLEWYDQYHGLRSARVDMLVQDKNGTWIAEIDGLARDVELWFEASAQPKIEIDEDTGEVVSVFNDVGVMMFDRLPHSLSPTYASLHLEPIINAGFRIDPFSPLDEYQWKYELISCFAKAMRKNQEITVWVDNDQTKITGNVLYLSWDYVAFAGKDLSITIRPIYQVKLKRD